MKAVSLVLALLVGCCSGARGQHFVATVQRYGPEQGLAHREVNAIFQDRRNFMWFGTKLGLSRFDGATFTTYTKEKNGLDFDDIHSIAQDADGLLWLMGPVGKSAITLFDPITGAATSFEQRFHQSRPSHPPQVKQLLLSSADGTIVFVDYQPARLHVYHPKTGLRTVALPPYKTLTLAAVTARNTVWVFADGTRLVEVTRDGHVLHTYDHPQSLYTCLGQSNAGAELVYRYTKSDDPLDRIEKLYKIDGAGHRQAQSPALIESAKIQYPLAYAFNQHGLLWNGCQLRDSTGRTLLDITSQLPSGLIEDRSFFVDKNGGMWLGTSFGLYQTRVGKNYFHRLFYESGDGKLPAVRGITTVGKTLYTNLENKGLFSSTQSGGAARRLLEKQGVFNSMSDALGGQLYLGHENTLVGYDYHTTQATVMPMPSLGTIWSIHSFSVNPYRLLAGGDPGLWLVDPATNRVIPFQSYNQFAELARAHVLHIGADRQGTIWLCATTGLYTIDPQRGVTARYWRSGKGPYKLPADSYQHFYQAPNGHYWLATANAGLVRWDRTRGHYRQFRRAQGLNNDNIYAVYADRRGHLWLSSDDGIMQFDPRRLTTRTYTVQDGITHNEFNRIAHYQDGKGRLYFGGLNGVTAFDPRDLDAEPPLPALPLRVVSLRQFDADRNTLVDKTAELLRTNQITLQPNDRSSILHFALLNYADAQKNTYAYQFKGVDNTWRYQTESSLRLGNLPYGDYQLLIRGKAADGRLSSATLSIEVHVLRPFYLRVWFAVAGVLLLMGGVWAWGQWRDRRYQRAQIRLQTQINEATRVITRQAQDLQQLDETKSRFFANITHEFRTPLTLILAPTQQMASENPEPKNRRRLQTIEQNAHQLLGLINQLLDLAKLEAAVMPIHESRGNLTESIRHWLNPLIDQASTQGIHLLFSSELMGEYWFDAEKLERIVYNLTANALKFTKVGTITVSLREASGRIRLTVADTGIGISAQHLPHIFDRFYQVGPHWVGATDTTPGTGIGLALVQELVQLQGGQITVESPPGRGTSFVVELPFRRVEPVEAVLQGAAPDRPETNGEGWPPSDESDEPGLLVVEDNDDLARFIAECLPRNYRIRRAVNGLDGLQQALEHLPDLIISDVMMPLMDGFRLCAELKADQRTSHIPIILLTAKSSVENRLTGLSLGADEYLTKPFQLTELQLRVRNQLVSKQRHREWLQASIRNPGPASPQAVSEPDDPFLVRLYTLFDAHLSDAKFGLEQMTSELGMSRLVLSRKVKALTGLSASKLFHYYRLREATHRLRSGISVSETAYQVGFESHAYFSKCFRDVYQSSPSEFIAQAS